MTIKTINQPEELIIADQKIIKTKYWELPEDSLEGWRPFTAFIDYKLFEGPDLKGHGRGLSLHKDLMGGIHGARGAGKSELLSFLLAKKMRSGKPVWTNYPISFYVIEENGTLTYYESQPLDFNKFYAFSREVRNGAVGITELQYIVEARTSGRVQNRVASYRIMQLRKTALSFMYDVQDRRWVDKRFGWSNDFDIECQDIAKMPYNRDSVSHFPEKCLDVYGNLREGSYVRFTMEDTSGVLTGTPFHKDNKTYGPYQFPGWKFWDIFPTYFIVDVYDAVNSFKQDSAKQDEKDKIATAMMGAIEYFLGIEEYNVESKRYWVKVEEIAGFTFSRNKAGALLREWGVESYQGVKGKWFYRLGEMIR